MSKKTIEELTLKQIESYMKIPFVKELCDFIEENYKSKPKFDYSSCSMQPGWNIKYKKNNKSLCVIYPCESYFTCLVTIINNKEMEDAVLKCGTYLKELYKRTDDFNGTKWLMIDVKDKSILEDVKTLINRKMEK